MLLKIYPLIMGYTILFLLGSCSPIVPTQTPLPFHNTPTLSTTASATITPSVTPRSPSGTDEIAAFINEMGIQGQFSGVVLLAMDDTVIWEYVNGLADRELNIPNRMGTKFNLGSMNKMFTAVAILQLMEQGKLALNDKIVQHIPDYPNAEVGNQVTIHQLLTYTSGLGDTFTEQFEANPNQYRSNEDYLPLFVHEPLQFAPGSQFSYSNAGYVVLGLIIEKVSGRSYDDYISQSVYKPSGMVDTGAYSIEDKIPNLAIGYTTQDIRGNETGVLRRNTSMMPGKGFAAGGGYSTAEDLFNFHNALFNYKLVRPASIDLLITGKVKIDEYSQYAYGFFDKIENGQRMVGHGGGAPGVCSFFNMYPETGYTIIVLSNSDNDCRLVLNFLRDNPLK